MAGSVGHAHQIGGSANPGQRESAKDRPVGLTVVPAVPYDLGWPAGALELVASSSQATEGRNPWPKLGTQRHLD